jgi:hypothetical protein
MAQKLSGTLEGLGGLVEELGNGVADSSERSIGRHTIGKSVWSMVVFPFVNVFFAGSTLGRAVCGALLSFLKAITVDG